VNYSYNSYGEVASRTDAKGQVVVYSYDGYARLTKVQGYPSGTGNAAARATPSGGGDASNHI
jgi:YD repeat-containing protein